MQRLLKQPDLVNVILVSGLDSTQTGSGSGSEAEAEIIQAALQDRMTLQDIGLRLRRCERHGYVSLESDGLLLNPAVERVARQAAKAGGLGSAPVLTYLANEITIPSERVINGSEPSNHGRSSVPYSTVTAFEAIDETTIRLRLSDGMTAPPLEPGQILLNTWAARDLDAEVGDRVRLEYYVMGRFGRLETDQAYFVLRGILPLEPPADDPGWTPEYPGVTDANTIADWDPPFPVDLTKVRDRDEEYWERHRATPKAFVSLGQAQKLWAHEAERFGKLTSFRCYPPAGMSLAAASDLFEEEFLERLSPAEVGLRFEPVKQQALSAGAGSTDFGMLFVGFSFFLIVSSAMLVALLFRLGVERRSREVGLLLAVGFAPRQVAKLLLGEGAVVAAAGGLLGLLGAVGFAWLMIAALGSWWSAAVQTPLLRLNISATSVVAGYAVSVIVAMLAVLWAIRGITRRPVAEALAGTTTTTKSIPETVSRGSRWKLAGPHQNVATVVAVLSLALAGASLVLPALLEEVHESVAFFCCGAAMLVAALALLARWMHRPAVRLIHQPGPWAVPRLGVRNVPRYPARSLLTIGLVASATFVITAIEAFRIEIDPAAQGRFSGTGGFALLAESAVPLPFDLNTLEGREALGLAAPQEVLEGVSFFPFRLHEGDHTSCLNLYKPISPRIIGATRAMIERGGFSFTSALAGSSDERDNPWKLLDRVFPDGAIPVIGDEASVTWQLHLGLGRDLKVTDERGREATLRFVALLRGSVLQGELVVAEPAFQALFPTASGYAFYLIDAPGDRVVQVDQLLERSLARFGFDVTSTAQRLADYSTVQNTYLSTFQMLGGLGLLLGTLGLAAVMLRNVWERRGELALMRALGFSTTSLGWMVLIENGALVSMGLLAGLIPALVAVAPHISQRPGTIPWMSLSGTLAAVFVVGIAAGAVALIPTLRTPLLPALRTE